jgi:hypothetical protein
LAAKAVKKATRWWRSVCLSGEPTRELSIYANTPSRPSVVQSIIFFNVCAALDSPKGVNKYSNRPNGVIIAVFGRVAELKNLKMVSVLTFYLITILAPVPVLVPVPGHIPAYTHTRTSKYKYLCTYS